MTNKYSNFMKALGLNESSIVENDESLFARFEKFGGKLKVGRMVIKGFPVDMEDSDGTALEMTAVDMDAAKGLRKVLRAAGFKVSGKNKDLIVENDEVLDEGTLSTPKKFGTNGPAGAFSMERLPDGMMIANVRDNSGHEVMFVLNKIVAGKFSDWCKGSMNESEMNKYSD